jgi:hypothetical protein
VIYLDYSANTPADEGVLETYLQAERSYFGNPNSNHPAGQAARQEMARVTEGIGACLGVRGSEIIYTSGATEANNLAIKGIAQSSRHQGIAGGLLLQSLGEGAIGGGGQGQGGGTAAVDAGTGPAVDLGLNHQVAALHQHAGAV